MRMIADGNKPINIGDSSYIYKGIYNPIQWYGDKPYRPRVETLIIKDGKYVYADIDDNIDSYPSDLRYKHYYVPGGSLDADSTKAEQAEAETNEEALIKVSLIYNTGISYYQLYEPGFIARGGDTPLEYYGSISDIFVGVYDGEYDKSKVDPKDLDPKMAEHGKFHDIKSIAKYLRKEHIDALIDSQFVSSEVKAFLKLMRSDNVNESGIIVPDRYIYHASTYKIDEFKPMGLDLGNAFTRPGWSTFCHEKYMDALVFGMLRSIQKWANDMGVDITPVFNKGKLLFSVEDFNKYTELRDIKDKFDFYIYTIDSEPLNIQLGNDSTIREYTFRESGVKPESVENISLSLFDIKELVCIVDDPESEEYNDYKAYFTHDYSKLGEVKDKLVSAVASKLLKPGDDVEKFMEDNGLVFDSDDIEAPEFTLDIDEPVLDSVGEPTALFEERYPIDCYGLPDRKAYPMPDEKHVRSAIKFFNYADEDEEKELAKNINKKIKEFNITDINVGDKNRFSKYYKPIHEGYYIRDYMEALEQFNVPKNKLSYDSYSMMKDILRSMVSALEADNIKDDISDEERSELIETAYISLANINQKQMALLEGSKVPTDVIRSKKFKRLMEESLQSVLEADDDEDTTEDDTDDEEIEDDDSATDYTAMADDADEDNEGDEDEQDDDDDVTDYEDMADNPPADDTEDVDTDTEADTPTDDEPAEDTGTDDDAGTEDTGEEIDDPDITGDTPTDDTTTDDTGTEDTGDDTGEEIDDPDIAGGDESDTATDYTAMADEESGDDTSTDDSTSTDSSDDTSSDDTSSSSDETDENNNRYDNKELKNYFLLNSFLSMHETVVDLIDSVNGMILPTPDANGIMTKVVKNLQTVNNFIEKFIQFQFSETDYAFNLYYYNILTNALRMNLKLLEEAVKIGEAKTSKKNKSKEE